MKLKIDENLSKATIYLKNKFDFSEAKEFGDAYKDISVDEYIVDFNDTNYMDSSGLGMLLNMKRSTGNKPIKLINCKPQIKKILIVSRFDEHFSIA
jgi:anti-anti-sigma factor